VFLLKLALLSSLIPLTSRFPFALFAAPISGRAAAALIPAVSPPQSDTGLGALAKNSRMGRTLAGALIACIIWFLLSAGLGWLAAFGGLGNVPFPFRASFSPGPAPVPGTDFFFRLLPSILPFFSLLTVFPVARLYRKGIGGYTGDALGMAVEIGETAHLALAFLGCRILFLVSGFPA
jgi:adenosylcobinamide-GDP ribazoletransferase